MHRIAVCDDNEDFLSIFEKKFNQYCKKYSVLAGLDCFSDSDLLAELVEEEKGFDAYILDIDMPVCSGIELARTIRENSSTAVIIFLTAYESFAKDGYGMNVSSYLLKSNLENELDYVLTQMFSHLDKMKNDKIYTISNQRKFIKMFQKDILYVYKKDKNAVFVLEEKKEEWERITLQEAYHKMNNPDMVMIDRGLIINLYHIQGIASDQIIMDNGEKLTTGRNNIKSLKKCLRAYWENLI